MGLFDKKYCDICGEKIGLLGNRKLEDGNCCKNCARKLSPWFSERRHSTVSEIEQQLAYREENREKAAQFQISREIGDNWSVLIDETHGWFTVTRDRNLAEANPDILDFTELTGCRPEINECRTELKHADKDGKQVSYNPPRYKYSYDFYITITVNTPYFDEMRFQLNRFSVDVQSEAPRGFSLSRTIDPSFNPEYRQYKQMSDEICIAMEEMRTKRSAPQTVPAQQAPTEPTYPAAPAASGSWICSACGGSNTGKFCEYCGTARP